MNLKLNTIIVVAAATLLVGCSSNNVRSFRADPNVKFDIPHTAMRKIHVKSVTMPEGDYNSIMCRAAGNIYLPQKMTYSQYISDALNKTLMSIDKLSNVPADAHSIDIVLTKVSFDSLAGEWYINGNISVDGNKAVTINTTTEYGTAYVAEYACRNTAESFDEAATNFIKKILSHPEVSKNLL